MPTPPLQSVTVIFSPYHVGIRHHAAGAGPARIREKGLVLSLLHLGVAVHEVEIEPVDDFDGDIGRSFEVIRRTAKPCDRYA
jgi:arginase